MFKLDTSSLQQSKSHLFKEKNKPDEEIDKVIQENKDKCLIDICRAILRKAQENE